MGNYLVTGNLGFIGRNLERELLNRGDTVVSFEKDKLEDPYWERNIESIFLSNHLDGVFHVGACSDTLEQDVNLMMLLNYEFSRYLGTLCMSHGVKMVYSSSAACYGIDGKTPANLYAWSKYAAEEYLRSMSVAVSLRYFNVFGPGEEDKGRMASVGYQAYKKYYLEKSIEEMKLFPGNPVRDFIYVDDVVSANLVAMDETKTGTVWDIGTSTPCGFEDFMDVFKIPYSYSSPEVIPTGYQFHTCANTEKILPNWSPLKEIKERIGDYKNYLDLKRS